MAAASLLLACTQSSPPPADPYAISKMDLKPVPAKLSAAPNAIRG